ncbi:hypothetical protein [Streptomyces sp. NPDC059649]
MTTQITRLESDLGQPFAQACRARQGDAVDALRGTRG